LLSDEDASVLKSNHAASRQNVARVIAPVCIILSEQSSFVSHLMRYETIDSYSDMGDRDRDTGVERPAAIARRDPRAIR
jgi:hypothetical protein